MSTETGCLRTIQVSISDVIGLVTNTYILQFFYFSNYRITRLFYVYTYVCRCSPLRSSHGCFSLAGRNSPYAYSQVLLGETLASSVQAVEHSLQLLDSLDDPACKAMLEHAICVVSRPPCNNQTSYLLPICPRSCMAYNRLRDENRCSNISLVESANELLDVSALQVLDQVLEHLNCSDVETYYFYENVSMIVDENCTDFFSQDQKGKISYF